MTPVEPNKPLALPQRPASSLADSQILGTGYLVPGAQSQASPPHHGSAGSSGPPTWSGLMQALRRRWPLAVGLAVVGACLAVAGVLTLWPPRYSAAVVLQTSGRGDSAVLREGHHDDTPASIIKLNVAGLLRNKHVLQAALEQKTSAGKSIKDLTIVRDQGGVDWLEGALKTDFQVAPDLLKISLSADRADEVTEVVNAVGKAVVQESSERERERREGRMGQLKKNQADLEIELSKLRQERNAREKDARIKDREIQMEKYRGALANLSKAEERGAANDLEQTKAKEELAALKQRLKKIDAIPVSPERLEEAFRKDTRPQGLFLELEKVEKDYITTKNVGREKTVAPILENLQVQKQDVQKRIADLRQQLRPELENRWREKLADEMFERSLKLADTLATLEKLDPILKVEMKRLQDEARQLEPASQPVPLEIVHLRERIANMEISLAKIAQTIQLIDADVVNQRVTISQLAVEPRHKDFSRQTKMAGMGGVLMFALALFGVAFLELRSHKISGVREVSQGLGLNVVGSLPSVSASIRKPAAGPRSLQSPIEANQLEEAIDGVRTMLLHSARTDNLRVLMVTSAVQGEGKTSLASQLAASLARSWRKTLLIDGDLRHPAAHKMFDLPLEPGLSEVLRNEVNAADAVKPTALSRLWLMPAGHMDSHAVQALAQDNVRTLFEQLKQQYDFIIVDSCPVLPVADALVLGQHVDGAIFSILRDVSRVPAVHAAQQKLNNLGIRTVGAVMIGASSDVDLDYQYAVSANGY